MLNNQTLHNSLEIKPNIDVLVVGSGGREHALAWKLRRAKRIGRLCIAPGNAGTESIGTNVEIAASDINGLVEYAKRENIDLVVVGPDDVLAAGLVDELAKVGIAAFGPTKSAAQLEASKPFAKDIMTESGIPTADYQTFTNGSEARAYVKSAKMPIVIKAGGLALGKGVVICQTVEEALKVVDDNLERKIFGESSNELVIEEFLNGQEISLHAICAGQEFRVFPSAQDHKQVGDGDKGPNTGGMGTVAPVWWFAGEKVDSAASQIIQPALNAMSQQGTPFNGLLFPGLMVVEEDTGEVLEFNVRFGDPETQSYMRLMKSDLLELIVASLNGNLSKADLEWHNGVAICVVAASGGYPGEYEKDKPITGIEHAGQDDDIVVFHAGTKKQDDNYVTSGGRVLSVTALGKDLDDARKKAYAALAKIKFDGMYFRTDIGLRKSPF